MLISQTLNYVRQAENHFYQAALITVQSLRTERSVSACFFKIAIFSISFSHVKWIYLLLESLMTELYLHIKIYFDEFQGRLKYAELKKSTRFTISVPVPKVVEVIP